MNFVTFSHAFNTPLPKYLFLSPSLNSKASYIPVDAPDGTAARKTPFPVTTSTSMVGFPLESRISREITFFIVENLFLII